MKTLLTLIMLSLTSFNVYADHLIEFSRIDQEVEHSRVQCRNRTLISKSDQTQQVKSYQALLTPRYFDQILDQSHFISFENLESPVTVYARGSESIALVKDVEIEVQIKTPNDEVLLSTLFFWSATPKEVLHRQKGFVEQFNPQYQGVPKCDAHGSRSQLKRCRFLSKFNMANWLEDQVDLIEEYQDQYPGEGMIIEVHYRNTLYTECTSTRAQASARGIGTSPKIYIRKSH
jgi:hypothetical protein